MGGGEGKIKPARREMKEILRVQHRKLASPPFSFTEKHGRPEEPKVILELIGKYQSECTLPHQSETPFVGERSFSNEQSVRAGGFFFLLPLPLPQFFFLSRTLGKLFTSPQLSTDFLFQNGGLNSRWKYISTKKTPKQKSSAKKGG